MYLPSLSKEHIVFGVSVFISERRLVWVGLHVPKYVGYLLQELCRHLPSVYLGCPLDLLNGPLPLALGNEPPSWLRKKPKWDTGRQRTRSLTLIITGNRRLKVLTSKRLPRRRREGWRAPAAGAASCAPSTRRQTWSWVQEGRKSGRRWCTSQTWRNRSTLHLRSNYPGRHGITNGRSKVLKHDDIRIVLLPTLV